MLRLLFSLCLSDLSNVALYKPASQSSDETPDFTASSAVDGISESDLFSKSCSSTYSWDPLITHAWWMVDLLKDYRIESITIQNRGDCCGIKLFVYFTFCGKLPPMYKPRQPSACIGVRNYSYTVPVTFIFVDKRDLLHGLDQL